ncbi:hypothetical protein N7466_003639, partial [Penicillium verhagenii]|uniref:uncharacterized protein n=1 Tax=Penicillium verhagenii TaxID=1562060 RepID=UPI0025450664
AEQNIIENLSFHRLNMIISGASTAFVCIAIFSLMFWHAIHLSNPREQIKYVILRISLLIPLYTITSFLSICKPYAYVYITPWLELFQAVALGSFFLLLCEFISRDSQSEIDVFFSAFQAPQKKQNKPSLGGLEWFRKQWIAIFQYPVVALLTSLATDFTQIAGVYCLESGKVYFAHVWLTIITEASVAFAVISVLTFYRALKSHLASHQPLAKLLAFKLIVGLTFLEKYSNKGFQIIFTILQSTNVLKPSSTLSYADVNIGIPNLVICLQMVPISVFFYYAYGVGPYKIKQGDEIHDFGFQEGAIGNYQKVPRVRNISNYQGGVLGMRALVSLFNPMEICRAIKFGFKMAQELGHHDERNKDSGTGIGINMSPESVPLHEQRYGPGDI